MARTEDKKSERVNRNFIISAIVLGLHCSQPIGFIVHRKIHGGKEIVYRARRGN